MALDTHLSRLSKGRKFLKSARSFCYLMIVLIMVGVAQKVWSMVGGVPLSGAGIGWGIVVTAGIGFVAALPYVFIAVGLRHIDNLFGAVHDALEELKTTV